LQILIKKLMVSHGPKISDFSIEYFMSVFCTFLSELNLSRLFLKISIFTSMLILSENYCCSFKYFDFINRLILNKIKSIRLLMWQKKMDKIKSELKIIKLIIILQASFLCFSFLKFLMASLFRMGTMEPNWSSFHFRF